MKIQADISHLPNGMRLVTHRYHRCPSVHLGLLFDVGSRHEQRGEFGLAHLCEHLMFCGTHNIPDFDGHMSPFGASNNAWTSTDSTCYLSSGPKELLPMLLRMEADRLTHLAEDLNQEKLNIEIDVVRNELREQYENSPYGQLFLQQNGCLFGENHPYGHPIIGNHEDIQATTLPKIQHFFARWYQPGNATLLISGDIDSKKSMELAQQAFEALPSQPYEISTPPPPSLPLQETQRNFHDNASYHYQTIEWILPPRGHPILQAFSLLCDILCAPRYGSLYQEIEIKQQLATSVECQLHPQLLASQFSISTIPNKNENRQQILNIIFSQLHNIAQGNISSLPIQQAKCRHQLGWLLSFEDLSYRKELMLNWLQNHDSFDGFIEHFQHVKQLSNTDIYQAAQWLIEHDHLLLNGIPA